MNRQIDHAAADRLMTVRVAPHAHRENAVILTRGEPALVRQGDAAHPEDLTAALRVLRSLLKVLEP